MPVLILYRNELQSNASFMDVMLEAAKVNKGRILFSYTDMKSPSSIKIANLLKLNEFELPVLTALAPKMSQRFLKCETKAEDLTVEIITKFIDNIFDNKFEPVFLSEPIPEENDQPLKVLVGHNFWRVVGDKTKDVFVLFHAPEDMIKKNYLQEIKELAKQMSSYPNLVIAKIDVTANDVEDEAPEYPLFKLYGTNHKKDGAKVYEGEKTLEEMKKWLENNAPTLVDAPPFQV